MKIGKTNRGFELIDFKDHYANGCSLQQSSLALLRQPGASAIWLGVNNANPQIMASQTPQGGNGWVPFHVPENVLLTTRMHLNRWMVKRLIPHLQEWLDTGSFKIKKRGKAKDSPVTVRAKKPRTTSRRPPLKKASELFY